MRKGVWTVPGRREMCRWGQAGRRAWFLEPTILLLLHHDPAHGYTLVDQLGEFGLEDPHPRVVYRMLRDMEENGWVTSTWDTEKSQGPPRRVYCLTAMGDMTLSTFIQHLQQTREQIDDLTGAYSRHMREGQGEYH
jgi:PadR family transcriptional regulator PadR